MVFLVLGLLASNLLTIVACLRSNSPSRYMYFCLLNLRGNHKYTYIWVLGGLLWYTRQWKWYTDKCHSWKLGIESRKKNTTKITWQLNFVSVVVFLRIQVEVKVLCVKYSNIGFMYVWIGKHPYTVFTGSFWS